MRVMVMVKANERSEAGELPKESDLLSMGRFNEELVKAGIMLSGDGLAPSSRGKRVQFTKGGTTVTDGPFEETRELVAGFWIWKVKDLQEAVDWVARAPFDGGAEIELRPMMEAEDFGAELTPAVRAQEERLRAEIAAQHHA